MLSIDVLKELYDNIPSTIYMAKKLIAIDEESMYHRWVVCIKCDNLYSWKEAVVDRKVVKCNNVLFPNHPHSNSRKPCNARLLQKIVSTDGKSVIYHPRKVYCTRSIKSSLEMLFKKKDFKSKLLSKSNFSDGMLTDMQDAEIYKTFLAQDGSNYFSNPYNIGFIMNVDWFQPFKNSEYSLGAIYMAITNLPREDRFKWENILLCGIIPGPKEPSHDMNTYIKPIVDELIEGWSGLLVDDGSVFKKLYRFALICLASDIPATRKCGGFLSFSGNKGNFDLKKIYTLRELLIAELNIGDEG